MTNVARLLHLCIDHTFVAVYWSDEIIFKKWRLSRNSWKSFAAMLQHYMLLTVNWLNKENICMLAPWHLSSSCSEEPPHVLMYFYTKLDFFGHYIQKYFSLFFSPYWLKKIPCFCPLISICSVLRLTHEFRQSHLTRNNARLSNGLFLPLLHHWYSWALRGFCKLGYLQ